jgi:hypothetical protein
LRELCVRHGRLRPTNALGTYIKGRAARTVVLYR